MVMAFNPCLMTHLFLCEKKSTKKVDLNLNLEYIYLGGLVLLQQLNLKIPSHLYSTKIIKLSQLVSYSRQLPGERCI